MLVAAKSFVLLVVCLWTSVVLAQPRSALENFSQLHGGSRPSAGWTSVKLGQYPRNSFVGDLVLQDVDAQSGMTWQLLKPFGYVDSEGVRWQAEKGLVTDCASIPRALWTIVGAPCTGSYRRAAIIHDFYCLKKYRPWRNVHRVFYDAMLASNVPKRQAQLMYAAVWTFGPRWQVTRHGCIPNPKKGRYCYSTTPKEELILLEEKVDGDEEQLQGKMIALKQRLEQQDLSLPQLEALSEQFGKGLRFRRRDYDITAHEDRYEIDRTEPRQSLFRRGFVFPDVRAIPGQW
jgi:hypothetical protein